MLVGDVPFHDTKDKSIAKHILTSAVEVPKNLITREAQELIHKLLMKNPFQRLGSGRSGPRDIMQQEWFEAVLKTKGDVIPFAWEKLAGCQLKAPYEPVVASDEDSSYFDHGICVNRKQTDLNRPFSYSLYEWCEEF